MPDPFQTDTLAFILLIGCLAGTLGGLLGVGGSVIIIPGLAVLFGTGENQHLYQASAMTANVAVALPAALRHRRANAPVPAVLRWMLPATLVAIVVGVLASNLPVFRDEQGGQWLGRILAIFLGYVVFVNLRKLKKPKPQREHETLEDARVNRWRCGTVGVVMGSAAGLLGIGGGALAVPLQQTLVKLPLRNAIANSSVVMVFSAAIGATLKLATLGAHYDAGAMARPAWQNALLLAALLAPTAIVGARIGAKLTHTLPLAYVRVAFVGLMIAAAVKMAALPF
jgi:hypothetical protein